MSWSLTFGSLFGTRLRVHFTFLIFLLWIGIAYWISGGPAAAATGLAFILMLFASVVAHEFGHIAVARRYGIRTPDVTLLPIGGVARLERLPDRPRQELAVALAGPVVNLVIAVPLALGFGEEALVRSLTPTIAAADLLPRLAVANLSLAAFNLLPAFPMDGGRALRALLAMRMGRTKATRIAARAGHALAFVFALVGLASGNPILIFIGLFVYVGASTEAYDVTLNDIAEGLRVSEATVRGLEPLGPESRLADAVALLLSTTQQEFPVLDEDGRLLGLLTRRGLVHGLRSHGESLPVREAMDSEVPAVGSGQPLSEALRLIRERSAPAVAVTDPAGRFVGLVTSENLNELMLVTAASGQGEAGARSAFAESFVPKSQPDTAGRNPMSIRPSASRMSR